MRTITKERAKDILEFGAGRIISPITDDEIMELARIALASLEAEGDSEPVAFINGAWTLVYYRPPKELGLKVGDKLYAAPPVSVAIHDEDFEKALSVLNDTLNDCGDSERGLLLALDKAGIEVRSDACRTAMLQSFGNSEQLNSPVIQDCSCRTCRPVTMTDMRFVVCHECGYKRCPHANDHRNVCTGSNEPGQEGSAYPAAPQQEVK